MRNFQTFDDVNSNSNYVSNETVGKPEKETNVLKNQETIMNGKCISW